jgi:hypothetical protein
MGNDYIYDLYDLNTFMGRVNNKQYALYWILNNYVKLNNITARIDIIEKIENKELCFEYLCIQDNQLIKINKYNYNLTIYSPYDLELFTETKLSLLYQLFYKKSQVQQVQPQSQSQVQQVQPQSQSQVQQVQQVQPQSQSQVQQPQVQQPQLQQQQQQQIQPQVQQPQQQIQQQVQPHTRVKHQVIQKLPEEFLKEDLDNMKTLLEDLKKQKKEFIEMHKKKEEKFLDIDCNKRYEEKKIRKENDKEKEKYNIFKADIQIYNKLIHEQNFSENFIPQLFEAKYYILKYLYVNDYFLDEDTENPSEELFELYRTIYDYVNKKLDDNTEIFDTFSDVFQEFNEFLPKDKKILTDKQIMDTLNEKSEKTEIFKSDSNVDILLAESDIDTDTSQED